MNQLVLLLGAVVLAAILALGFTAARHSQRLVDRQALNDFASTLAAARMTAAGTGATITIAPDGSRTKVTTTASTGSATVSIIPASLSIAGASVPTTINITANGTATIPGIDTQSTTVSAAGVISATLNFAPLEVMGHS
ncbi:MAG: hypothetical protein ACYDHD_05595 [Vulcanimicrobiaceae bacterium]